MNNIQYAICIIVGMIVASATICSTMYWYFHRWQENRYGRFKFDNIEKLVESGCDEDTIMICRCIGLTLMSKGVKKNRLRFFDVSWPSVGHPNKKYISISIDQEPAFGVTDHSIHSHIHAGPIELISDNWADEVAEFIDTEGWKMFGKM